MTRKSLAHKFVYIVVVLILTLPTSITNMERVFSIYNELSKLGSQQNRIWYSNGLFACIHLKGICCKN